MTRRTFASLFIYLPFVASCWTSGFGQTIAWTVPTAEELSMTSQAQVPGAAAVYLNREQTTDDHLHVFSIYIRLKVLTERGKDLGTVELPYVAGDYGGGKTVEDVAGRTIHSDGRIIPFTGKPLEKMVQKSGDLKYMTKVFSLPEVEVGSILEYRYNLRMSDRSFSSPDWYVQSDLFTRKVFYRWKPTDETLIDNDDGGKLTSGIAWWPVLPAGVELKQIQLPPVANKGQGQRIYELTMQDVPPAPDEEHMPPLKSLTYRVLFFYTPYRTRDEFWKNKGKLWAKRQDKFVGPGPGVSAEVRRLVTAGDSQEQQLKKLYAAVMDLENTDFTREHSRTEEKADGLKEIKNTDDVLERKRGSSDQMAGLFVAMARAAGMKAYVAVVTNRDQSLFMKGYMNFSQLNDDVAIVTVDGKERYFDPGSRYCPFGELGWKHTLAGGVRQMDSGTALMNTPGQPYTSSEISRVADLKMNEQGVVTGFVKLTYRGAPALRWRQASLTGDETSLKRDLTSEGERLLPGGMEVAVQSIAHLKDYEQPLIVTYNVSGAIGSSTAKRLLIPGDLFQVNAHPEFPHAKRETAIYFEYPYEQLDAIRITFPPTMSLESSPVKEVTKLQTFAVYMLSSQATSTSITMRRNFMVGDVIFPSADYGELRNFYSKVDDKDQESIVLTRTTPKTAQGTN